MIASMWLCSIGGPIAIWRGNSSNEGEEVFERWINSEESEETLTLLSLNASGQVLSFWQANYTGEVLFIEMDGEAIHGSPMLGLAIRYKGTFEIDGDQYTSTKRSSLR